MIYQSVVPPDGADLAPRSSGRLPLRPRVVVDAVRLEEDGTRTRAP